MRWSLILCLLLVSVSLARPRPKRSLGYIKSLITSKLFGRKTFVIVRPILAKNETYQTFKIPGFDDILLKVSRNKTKKPNKAEEKDKVEPAKPVDLAIVKPEVAIIGSYLGTKTQKETLLAIEMVKSLVKSGILTGGRDNSIQKVLVPIIPEPPRLEVNDVISEDQGHIFVPLRVGSTPVHSEYPPLSVSPELNQSALQSKYSYKQKGPNADMTYESHNNKDVIVTRTEKEPPLPQFLKFRIADVANIGANSFAVRRPLRINGAPGTYPYYISSNMISESVQGLESLPYLSHRIAKPNRSGAEPEYIGNNVYEAPILADRNFVLFTEPLSFDVAGNPYYFGNHYQQVIRCKQKNVGKVCPHDQNQVKTNNDQHTVSNVPSGESKLSQDIVVNKLNEAIKDNKDSINANRIAVNEFLKNQSVNGQLVSQYIYKQMNHHSLENYTEVKVGSSQKKDILVESGKNLHKDFIFIPPKETDLPTLNVLSLNNELKTSKSGNNVVFTSKVKSNGVDQNNFVTFKLKSNEEHSFNQNPIVVSEQNDNEEGEKLTNTENSKTNEIAEAKELNIDEYTKRGDIPSSTF